MSDQPRTPPGPEQLGTEAGTTTDTTLPSEPERLPHLAHLAHLATKTTIETARELAREAVLHPTSPVNPWNRRVAIGLGIVRIGLGFAALVVPEAAGRVWIGDGASGRDKAVLLRALGGRDVALGAGVLLSARHRGSLRRWVLLGALSDLVDTLSTAAGFTELPKWRRWLVLGASGSAVATALVVAPGLAEVTS